MQFDNILVDKRISIEQLKTIASRTYGERTKAVVDVSKKIMVIGPELHAEGESFLIDSGSMINIRPGQGNRTRGVEDAKMRQLITSIVLDLVD